MNLRPYFLPITALFLIGGLFLSPSQARGQAGVSDTEVSAQIVQSRIEEVQVSADMDDETRSGLIESYRKTLGFIEAARTYTDKAAVFSQTRKSAPGDTQAIRQKLAQAEADAALITLDLADDAPAREIEPRLQTEQANHAAVAAKLASFDQQLAMESKRPRVVRERLLKASKLAEKLAGDLQAPGLPDQAPLVREARRWFLTAQAAAANAEIQMLDQELLSQPTRIELLQAQRDQSAQALKSIDRRIELLQERLMRQRRNETEQVIAATDAAVLGAVANDPLIRELVQKNAELSEYLQNLNDDLEQVETATRIAADKLKVVQQNFQTARQRLEIAGLNQALGQVLHEQRRELPDLSRYRQRSSEREAAMAQVGLRGIQLETESKQLQDMPVYIDTLLVDLPESRRARLVQPAQELLAARRALLKNALLANREYLSELGELDFQENQLQTTADEFDSFLVERLLWVRNKDAIGVDSFLALPAEIISFVVPRPWLEAFQVLLTSLVDGPLLALIWLICGVLFWKKAALSEMLQGTAKTVGQPADDNFTITARALGISILLALPWFLLSSSAGWEISRALDSSVEAKGIGIALLRVSPALFYLSAFRVLCAEGGLAEAHFNWPPEVARTLQKQLNRLFFSFLLPVFMLITAIQFHPTLFGGELVRILFVIASAGLLLFAVQALRPKVGIFDRIRNAKGHSDHLSWLWVVLGTAIPAIFAVAALAGYLYSAMTLMTLLVKSLWLILALIIMHQLASRWLLIVSGRLQLKVALERRAAARVLRNKMREASAGGENIPVAIEDNEIDVANIDADTHKLLNLALVVGALVGMGAIWASVLPALTMLQDFILWEFLDGPVGQQTLKPVTLADLLLALAYIFVAIVAARTVPSLIEAVLRQRDTITPGTRVAFATLGRYSIALVAVAMVANVIGFNWGQIQWLVAALGVGIGFGLQEIIANFISGLIILVERPIRVGDLVTVGDASGTVTRLQIRATTVTNFDRQELLVPNKEFITGRVLNWSLSDEVIRLVVNIGVAYGTDMDKALELVREAVNEHKLVLNDPQPLVTFESFGDNSLNITVRAFIGSLNKRREAISDLNLAINKKLTAAGIVIAFPQRDVHLDTSRPLDIRIQHGSGAAAQEPPP